MPNLNLGLFSALLCIGVSAIISTNVNAAVPNYDSLKSELKAETRQFNRDMNASQKAFNAEMRTQAANDIYEYDMQELGNTLDARKSGRTWATVGGAVGGAGLGVGIMELFGNRLIGGKVMGQKSLDEVELLYSQMTTTERAQYEEAITELGRACDELHALGGVHSACGD